MQKAGYADLKVYLPNDPLVKVDRMSMAHSIESRVPLLDNEVIEFASTLPASLKIANGRRKHVLITSYGRNVSPEWPEAELLAGPAIVQAAVFGEAQPQLCALVVPAAGASASAVEAQVRAANARLPDYAQIGAWLPADAPFTPQNGLATSNGRARREALWSTYGKRLNGLL